MIRLVCEGDGSSRFSVRGTVEWSGVEVECESENEMCGVCMVGFSNLCFYSLISLLTYLFS